ncbi:MAG: hypothetical protein ACQGVK_01675 [Myxococcota bacterium]
MRASFWIDAGPRTGGGHVARAESLAAALAPFGIHSTLVADDASAVRSAGSDRFEATDLPEAGFAAACRAQAADVAVVDLPHTRPADPRELAALSSAGIATVAFDASDPTRSQCDLWVDAVADGATPLPPRVRGLLGPRYAVLREGLGPSRSPQPREAGEPVRILVGFGAADPARLTARALRALAPLGAQVSVDVLVGPLVPDEVADDIALAADALPRVRLHEKVRNPLDLLQSTQLGVFAFGNLFLEAAACGVAAVLWHPSGAHAEVSERFARHFEVSPAVDVGAAGERSDPRSDVELCDAIEGLLRDPVRRSALSKAARRAVDGRGAERVATAIARLAGS